MRILLLSQWFDPEPAFKGLSFAKELQRRGHEVQVVTGFPNYPGGKLYPGYRVRALQRETMDGVSVVRVPLYPSHGTSALGRTANYLSFAVSSATLGTVLAEHADVMYVYHPPATAGIAGAALALARQVPFVYDVQDLWPDTLAATGMMSSQALLKGVGRVCDFIYARAARIAVLSPGFRAALVERGVAAQKVEVIYNWCDETVTARAPCTAVALDAGMAGRFNVVFAGTMGRAQALDAVLDAARLITVPAIQFVFIGAGIDVERLKKRVEAEGIKNCLFLPRRPPETIGDVLEAADVLLVHLRDDPLFRITIPSKTQAYLSAGRPIVMAVRGDAADLIRRSNAGLCCSSESPTELADAVMRLYGTSPEERRRMGQRGKAFYARELSMKAGVDRFERLFMEVSAERMRERAG